MNGLIKMEFIKIKKENNRLHVFVSKFKDDSDKNAVNAE